MKRIYAFDNFKAFLMLCVIGGHLMEVCTAGKTGLPLYRVIYSFHMPAFLFLSGFFGKFRFSRLLRLGGLYLIFQVLYKLFVHVYLRSVPFDSLSFSFATPYWLLWYLLVMLYDLSLIPLLERVRGRNQIAVLAVSIAAALLAGYCSRIGYYLSLSRFFCFLPFFIGGFYLGQHRQQLLSAAERLSGGKRTLVLILGFFCMLAAVYLCLSGGFSAKMMYGSYGYFKGYGPVQRAELYGIALLWLFALLSVFLLLLKSKIPFLSWFGKNTLVFYLLHGFVIKAILYL